MERKVKVFFKAPELYQDSELDRRMQLQRSRVVHSCSMLFPTALILSCVLVVPTKQRGFGSKLTRVSRQLPAS